MEICFVKSDVIKCSGFSFYCLGREDVTDAVKRETPSGQEEPKVVMLDDAWKGNAVSLDSSWKDRKGTFTGSVFAGYTKNV